MKKIKRILSLMLSASLVLGIVLTPGVGVTTASAASTQSGSDQTIHPFKGTDALVQDTIEELMALGETAEETKDDKVLAAKVEKASDLTYDQARSLVYGALTEDYDATQIDVSELGLSESVMSDLMESILADHYLSRAFTDLSYTTEGGKVTQVNYKVAEGYAAAMAGYDTEVQDADLSEVEMDVSEAAAAQAASVEAEDADEAPSFMSSYSVMALTEDGEEEEAGEEETTGCTNHTVGAYNLGDYNKDEVIDNDDVTEYRQMMAEGTAKDDYNDDGIVNVADLQKFANMVAAGEVKTGDPSVTFTWQAEPYVDFTAVDADEDGTPDNAGLVYNAEEGKVEYGILPHIYYRLESVSFYCSECGQDIVIDRSTDEGAEALDEMIAAKDVWINTVTYESVTCDAGSTPVLPEGSNEDDWILYTEMEVAFYTDDTFSVGPVIGEDGNPIVGEDGNPVYAPATDEDGNTIGLYATGQNDSMDNGPAQVEYFYSVLSTFINDKSAYFGTPTDFWTSKNSESNPMAALKYVCNVDPDTDVPPGQMTMMVRDLPQAFMAYYYQYGDVLADMRDAAIDAMPDGLTDVQQLLFLHDWLAENAWFDMGAMTAKDEDGNPASSDPIQMTTFGALLSNQLRDSYDANGDGEAEGYYGALCPGYAAAYNLLVQAAHPEVYMVKDENGDSVWATYTQMDEAGQSDIVDFVQVLFYTNTAETSIAGEGFGGGWFNNVHYFSAVKTASPDPDSEGADEDGNAWYYVDACYDDIYIECLQQYRGESDGSVNHTYFMLSPQTCATLYGDNVERIDSLYDGYVYNQTDEKYEPGDDKYNEDDPDHLKYEKLENPDEFMYDDTSYEDSWFSGAVSKVYWGDDGYVYYVDGGASAASYSDMMDQMGSEEDNEMADSFSMSDMMHGTRVNVESQDLMKKRLISDPDFWPDEEEDDETSMFSSKEDPYAKVILDYGTGEMTDGVVLADEVVEDFVFNEQYPALTHTVALYNDKLYFNLSNDIYVCDTDGTDAKLFMEYNDVKATSDGRVFTATSYTLDENGKDLSVSNKPIGAICVHTTYEPQYQQVTQDGQTYNVYAGMETGVTMTVNIATNYSFTSDGTDEDAERYSVEAVNFNPDYQLYGEKEEGENDNSEFMWCAVIRDELDIASVVKETSGSDVTVSATCTRPAYTDSRTASGVILSRQAVDGSEPTGHNFVYDETEGVYLCEDEDCRLHATVKVEEPTNGTVTLYATSSNGMEGLADMEEFEGMDFETEVIPVSTAREAETKNTGDIEIQCEPEEGYRVAKVEYKYEDDTEYSVLDLTVPEVSEDEDAETVDTTPKYILSKEEGCVSIKVTFEQVYEITVEQPEEGGTIEVIGIEPEEAAEGEEVDENVTTYLAAENEVVNLAVKAEEGYVLDKVTVMNGETEVAVSKAGESAAEGATHTFTMPAGDVTITATFLKQSTVTIAETTGGTVTAAVDGEAVTSDTLITEGTTVELTVTPDPDNVVESVTVGEQTLTPDEDGKYSFTMPAEDVTVTVTFKATVVTYDVDVTVTDGTGGKAEADVETAAAGDKVTVTVTPDTGYEVDSVTVNGAATSVTKVSETEYTFEMPAEAAKVEVTFKATAVTYDVDVTVTDGTGGKAEADVETAAAGDKVTVTVTPDTGYKVGSVTLNGAATSVTKVSDTEYTFEMPAEAAKVEVTFVAEESDD